MAQRIEHTERFRKAVSDFIVAMKKLGIDVRVGVTEGRLTIGFTAENFAEVLKKKAVETGVSPDRVVMEVVPYFENGQKVHYILMRIHMAGKT